jgi:hypothetical protein
MTLVDTSCLCGHTCYPGLPPGDKRSHVRPAAPDDEGNRTIWRAIRHGLANGVEAGLADGLAQGLRRHVPGCVAIVVKGTPLCMLCAFFHLVLGVALPATTVAALLGATGIGGTPSLARAIRRTNSRFRSLDGSSPDTPPAGDHTGV